MLPCRVKPCFVRIKWLFTFHSEKSLHFSVQRQEAFFSDTCLQVKCNPCSSAGLRVRASVGSRFAKATQVRPLSASAASGAAPSRKHRQTDKRLLFLLPPALCFCLSSWLRSLLNPDAASEPAGPRFCTRGGWRVPSRCVLTAAPPTGAGALPGAPSERGSRTSSLPRGR